MSGEVLDQPGVGNRLAFELPDLDQTQLSTWLSQISEIESRFPVVGEPCPDWPTPDEVGPRAGMLHAPVGADRLVDLEDDWVRLRKRETDAGWNHDADTVLTLELRCEELWQRTDRCRHDPQSTASSMPGSCSGWAAGDWTTRRLYSCRAAAPGPVECHQHAVSGVSSPAWR